MFSPFHYSYTNEKRSVVIIMNGAFWDIFLKRQNGPYALVMVQGFGQKSVKNIYSMNITLSKVKLVIYGHPLGKINLAVNHRLAVQGRSWCITIKK